MEQGKLRGADVAPIAQPVDLHGLELGIDHPVLRDAEALVELAFDDLVGLSRTFGEDLDDEVGHALDIRLGDDRRARRGDEEQIGLDDVGLGKEHVQAGGEDLPRSRGTDVLMEQKHEVA